MASLFESKVGQVVLESYLKAKADAENKRKSEANDRLSIYYDSWGDILESLLESQFHPKNYKRIRLMKNTTQNILKKVVDDISVVYKVAPRRTFTGGGADKMEEIYSKLGMDEFMLKVNQYATLLNDLLIRGGWDRERKRITLHIHTPANTSIIQREDYPEEAMAVFYDVEYIDTKFNPDKKSVFWSADEHFIFDEKFNIFPPAPDNQEMLNPFKKLPFAFIHLNQIPDNFWNPKGGNDLVEGTTLTGFKRTLKDYLYKCTSFKQLWLRTQNPDKIPAELLSDPLSVFLLDGEGSEMGLLDLQANFEGMEKSIQADANGFLATYGLSIDSFVTSPSEASGKALLIKNRGLREIRESQMPAFRRFENDIFELIRLVWNTENPGQKISESLEFKIDFAEMEMFIDPMEKRKQAQSDLKDGIISPAQFYMIFNPDITDPVEAEKAITENLAKLSKIKGGGGVFNLQNLFGGGGGQAQEQTEE